MKHKHSELIKALADNTELVKFIKACEHGAWTSTNTNYNFSPSNEYYLCLEMHKEACLHWLNGGELTSHKEKIPLTAYSGQVFNKDNIFLDDMSIIEIKPKTININGHEVPEPMRVKLERDEKYFTPSLTDNNYYVKLGWDDVEWDNKALERGLVHTTKEGAIAHTKALLSLTEG